MTWLSGEFIAGVTDKVTVKSFPVVKVSGASSVTEGLAKFPPFVLLIKRYSLQSIDSGLDLLFNLSP